MTLGSMRKSMTNLLRYDMWYAPSDDHFWFCLDD